MKQLHSFILIFFLICSHRSDTEELALYNDLTFELCQGEKLKEINVALKELYLGYLRDAQFQVPLFKIIENEGYVIFIGIPYNTSIKELLSYNIPLPNGEQVEVESNRVYCLYKKHKNNSSYIIEYGNKFDENFIYVLSVVYSNEKINLFTKVELIKRVKRR